MAKGLGHGLTGIIGGLGAHSALSRFKSYSGHGLTGPFGQTAFYSADSTRHATKFGAKAAFSGLGASLGGAKALAGGYLGWRKQASAEIAMKRAQAESLRRAGRQPFSKGATRHMDRWGRQKNGFRRFGARSPGEHLKKGVHNTLSPKFGVLSPLALGLNVGLAAMLSSDNMFDPYNGMARGLATNIGAEAGFIGGGAAGAALAAALVPGGMIAAAIGFIGGGIIGSEAGAGLTDMPWKFSQFGNKYGRRSVERRSQFQDSEYAATMRQRAMQSIRRSHMSARSAFGQEALAYHS